MPTCIVGMELGKSGNVARFPLSLDDSQVREDGKVFEVLVVVGGTRHEQHLGRQLDLVGFVHSGIDGAAGTRVM